MSDIQNATRAAKEAAEITGTYNGWRNYPTWCVNLWLSNDEELYNETRERARNATKRGMARAYDKRERKGIFADELKTWVTYELAPDLGATFAADLLGYALGEVDWYEIAESWLRDLSE